MTIYKIVPKSYTTIPLTPLAPKTLQYINSGIYTLERLYNPSLTLRLDPIAINRPFRNLWAEGCAEFA